MNGHFALGQQSVAFFASWMDPFFLRNAKALPFPQLNSQETLLFFGSGQISLFTLLAALAFFVILSDAFWTDECDYKMRHVT